MRKNRDTIVDIYVWLESGASFVAIVSIYGSILDGDWFVPLFVDPKICTLLFDGVMMMVPAAVSKLIDGIYTNRIGISMLGVVPSPQTTLLLTAMEPSFVFGVIFFTSTDIP